MTIVWRDQMSVGIKAIDDDHQQLISLINQFAEATSASPTLNGKHESVIRSILGRLQSYTQEHFQREERIQALAGYEGLKENRQHHLALSKSLQGMIERFSAGEAAEKPLTAQELSKFLNSWLVDHIIKVDLKMRQANFQGIW
ncbi:MAG TPA: bacteriohemerythrin [Candidatus Sulfotelmatobacter sp.]|jgi:hemerythrin-like metal-binding protein|nr:bacteriohemerythrin [Candidatus Sulfotelmatobacter sp.]